MRIVFLTSSTNLSGGARQALYLAQGFQRRGHEVFFFTQEKSELRSLDPAASFWRSLGREGEWRRNMEAVLFEGPGRVSVPTVVHAFHNLAVKRLAWWGIGWRRRGVVCAAHRGVVFRPNNPLPYWSPGIDCFIVNSQSCAAVIRSLGVRQNRVRVVYNSVPEERVTPQVDPDALRRELGLDAQDFVFGTVGGDNPVKGVSTLLEAFARANLRRARLVVLGVTPDSWNVRARELGIADRLTLVGRTDRVADYLQLFSVFVLPSLSESMPNTLLEAIRSHLPCICSRVGGVPEVIGKAGLLVEPEDVGGLAAAMERMRCHDEAREAMREATILQAEQFEPEKRLDAVEGVYKDFFADGAFAASR